MQIDADYLRQRYSEMETEELIELHRGGTLTEQAAAILNEILNTRGVAKDQLVLSGQELENIDRAAIPEVVQQGIGGWLMVLVIALIALNPLLGFSRLSAEIADVESTSVLIQLNSSWTAYKALTWACFWVFAATSIGGGAGLILGKECSAVRRAKLIIWIIGPLATSIMGAFIPFIVLGANIFEGNFLIHFVVSVVSASIWTAYLSTSRRVRATYKCP